MTNKTEIINEIVASTEGKAFTVVFEKANGDLRTLIGRIDVTKYLKNGVATYNGKDNNRGNIGVFEMVKDKLGRWAEGRYRCFNAERVLSIKANGKTYEF